jgi:hypothetical protein
MNIPAYIHLPGRAATTTESRVLRLMRHAMLKLRLW